MAVCRTLVADCNHISIVSFAQLRSLDVCNSVLEQCGRVDIFAVVKILPELISVCFGYFNFTRSDMTPHDGQTMID